MTGPTHTVSVKEVNDARADVRRAKLELESAQAALRAAQANVIEAEEELSRTTEALEALERIARFTVCDVCGDESNSEPNLTCGRVEDNNPPCPGVYRRKR